MKPGFSFCLLGAPMLLLSAVSAAAQPSFTCPKPGTVEQRGAYVFKYEGATAGDPLVCQGTDAFNKPFSRLFNYYGPIGSKGPGVRDGMLALLSGKHTAVSFTLGDGATDTWKFLRREKIAIAGRSFETMVFDLEHQRHPNSTHPFHGNYTRWLAPAEGLWIRATLNTYDGEVATEGKPYRDTAVTLP